METNTRYAAVSLFDRNLDLSRISPEELREYRDQRSPSALPPAKPGTSLTIFHLRPLSRQLAVKFIQAAPPHERNMLAFQLAVDEVENLTLADGRVVAKWFPNQPLSAPGGAIKIVDERDLDMFPLAVIEEIGALAYGRAFLAGTSAAWSRLPPSLDAALASLGNLHADIPRPETVAPSS